MKKHRLLIPGFIFIVIAVFAVVFYGPGEAGALNPSHISCATCHSLHTAPGQSLTSDAVVEVLCLSCHGPAGTATKKAEVHTNKSGSAYAPFTMGCTDCHNPHDNQGNHLGGTNLSQVGKSLDSTGYAMIPTPNSGNRYVVFENRGSNAVPPYDSSLHSFASGDEDGDGNYEGACEVCHTQVSHHRNYADGDPSHDHTHFVGQNCTVCHPHISNFNPAGGGSCDACHSSIYNGEFTQTSHHLGGAAVTAADCAVCHQEPDNNHMNGNIDLKDPDTGNPLNLNIPRGATRDTAVLPANDTWDVVQLQNSFCFKCHDSNGAQSVATPMTPFSSGHTVPNIWDLFDPANNYHHAVRQAFDNTFCNANTMEPPWDTQAANQITCFDCHETTGHGSANQRMLRTAIDLATMETTTTPSSLPAGMGLTVETFCTLCHKASEYVAGAANSKFEYHGVNQNQHRAAGGNELGCLGCHGGIVNFGGVADNGSARGNIHGGSFQWPSDTWSANSFTDAFIVGGWISGWQANTSSGNDGCGGGDCNHPGSTRRNTPGKEYTQVAD